MKKGMVFAAFIVVLFAAAPAFAQNKAVDYQNELSRREMSQDDKKICSTAANAQSCKITRNFMADAKRGVDKAMPPSANPDYAKDDELDLYSSMQKKYGG